MHSSCLAKKQLTSCIRTTNTLATPSSTIPEIGNSNPYNWIAYHWPCRKDSSMSILLPQPPPSPRLRWTSLPLKPAHRSLRVGGGASAQVQQRMNLTPIQKQTPPLSASERGWACPPKPR